MFFTLQKDRSVFPRRKKAQTAIEYLLVLGVVTAVTLVGFRLYVPLARDDANRYYLSLLRGVYGNSPPWDPSFNAYP